MKTSKFFFAAVLGLTLSLSAWAGQPLSNQLPSVMVKQIVDEGLWENSFDDGAHQNAQDLSWFWSELSSGKQDPNIVVDQMFGTSSGQQNTAEDAPNIRLPRLYPVKVVILRYLQATKNSPRVQKISQAWMERYVDMALTTIDISGINDLKVITQNFRQKMRARQLQIVDLAPAERERLLQVMPKSHGVNITARDLTTRRFQITGLYNDEQKYFAVDFARPMEETLITFSHEMVHAADPKIAVYRAAYEKSYNEALAVLVHWLEGAPEMEKLVLDIVDHVFFETGLQQFKETADNIRNRRVNQLRDVIKNQPVQEVTEEIVEVKIKDPKAIKEGKDPKDVKDIIVRQVRTKVKTFEPTEQEIAVMRRWIGSAIGLTVENEYRAYGYSMVLYGMLKGKFQVLPQSKDKQEFIEKILAGDDVLATNLSVFMNPFRGVRSEIFSRLMMPAAQRNNENGDVKTKFMLLKVGKVIDYLELFYLEETEKFLKSLNDQMANQLRAINIDKLREPGILPEWAKPGGWDLPSNPMHILTARITTAWVYRFRQNVDTVLQELKNMNEPLAGTRFGILDLHDVTRGERKLIGISYENSPYASDPVELDSRLKSDLDAISIDTSKYFPLVQWSPESALRGDYIDGKTVTQNLIRLRMLKAATWLDNAFPPFKNTLIGIKSYIQRLRDGLSATDDLSPERVKELDKELVDAWGVSSQGRDELLRMRLLLSEITLLYDMANDTNWSPIAQNFREKYDNLKHAMDLMNVEGTKSIDDLNRIERESSSQLAGQLQKYEDDCQRVSRSDSYSIGGLWSERGPFSLGGASFPLTIVCHRSKIYLVRQPGDVLIPMTTLTPSGIPESRIFIGSRPVRLYPVDLTRKDLRKVEPQEEKKSKSCFLFFCN